MTPAGLVDYAALAQVYAVAPQEVTGRPRVQQLARKVGFQG